jgi:hypothetical protein
MAFRKDQEQSLWNAVANYRSRFNGQPQDVKVQAMTAVLESHVAPFYRKGGKLQGSTATFIESNSGTIFKDGE